jgi:hypothetical protein
MDNFIFLITFFTPLFIFNFTSLFILAQENFHKFNSIKLLRMVLSPLVILFCIIVPAGIILLTITNVIPESGKNFYSACGIVYGIATSIYLLQRLKKMLDPIYAAKRIISEIKENDFFSYKKRLIPKGQSNFDDLLRLCCGVVERNDEFESAIVFEFIFDWFYQHIDQIKPCSKVYWDQKSDKFNGFFLSICEKINQKDNSVIKINYVNAIYKSFLTNIDYRDFDKNLFQLKSLNSLADVLIERGLCQDNLVAEKIFRVIINPCVNILGKMQPSSYEKNRYVIESNDYKDFKETFLDGVTHLYKVAIKYENIDFISHTFIASRLFNSHDIYKDNEFIAWNGNYLQCYEDISSIYKDVFKLKNYDRKCVQFVLYEYRHILDAMRCQDASRSVVKSLFNTCMNDLMRIFTDLIKNTNILRFGDFDIFYDVFIWGDVPDDYQAEAYLRCFSILLEIILAKPKEDDCEYNRTACDLWMRAEQILEKMNKLNKSYAAFWKEFYDNLRKQFPNSYDNYQKYRKAVDDEIKQIKKAMSEEVYKP